MIPIVKPIIGDEEKKAVMEVLESGMLAQGAKVKELEEKFSKIAGTKYAVALNSGTAAIHASLHAIGIKPGDEVICPPFTFVATANPIVMEGAKVVFADVKYDTFNLNPAEVEKKITDKTKAIIAVDLFGQPADYPNLQKIADNHNLHIIEDACQSVNANLNGKKAGSFGKAAAFSFYATKNLISGEGGMITTDDKEIAELAKRFRHHGQSEQTRYEYYDLGYNYRMMDLQAAIALAQLDKIDDITDKRIENAKLLSEGLKEIKGITIPIVKENVKHVFHQYTIKCTKRDELMKSLKENNIGCAIFYPKPLHLHPHFAKMGYKEGDFPVAERLSKEVLSLPVHPGVTKQNIQSIINTIKAY